MRWSLLLLLCACTGADDPDPPGDVDSDLSETAEPLADPVADARERLAEAGFVVQDGQLHFADYSGCCDPDAKCLGNNPSTPYGSYALPTAPGDPGHPDDIFAPWGPVDPGLSRLFRMRADEALVWIGTVPPEAKYLGIRSYLITTTTDTGELRIPMGAVGPSLNQLVLAEERQVPLQAVWGEPLVVITTLDAAVERQVEQLLIEAGFDPATVHYDRIPPELVSPGLTADADTFHVSVRVAVDADPEAGAAYRADSGATVLRLTPDGPQAPVSEPHPIPDLPPKGTGVDESAWLEAYVALGQAVLARHGPGNTSSGVAVSPQRETDSLACLATETGCVGEIRDRYVAVSPQFVLPTAESYAVVFGVNHERSGKASYSNFAAVSDIHGIGVDGVDSRQMVGSARTYLPDHPLVDDLYAWTVARDCAPHEEPCFEVPYTCPGALPLEPLQVTIRAYLEPTTGAAPLADELLPDQLWQFAPE